MSLITLISFLMLPGCSQESANGSRCEIVLSGGALPPDLCVDYPSSTARADASAHCATLPTTYSAGGYAYSSTDGSCSTANRVGTCATSFGSLRYYDSNNQWAASSAQSDCTTTHSGTWTSG